MDTIDAPVSYSINDPCYDPAIGQRLTITLNGQPIDGVISYDTTKGHILCYVRDENGNYILNDAGDEMEKELLVGDVVASLKAAHNAK